jgi:hypothetical protein
MGLYGNKFKLKNIVLFKLMVNRIIVMLMNNDKSLLKNEKIEIAEFESFI